MGGRFLVSSILSGEMRIYINNRNYLTWTRAMVEILMAQGHDVLIFDNASNYPPLLEWYQQAPCPVVCSQVNFGNKAIWRSGILQGCDEPYVVTDPDLDVSNVPADWPEKLMEGCIRYNVFKCGFSLDETLVPPENPAWVEDDFCNHPEGLPQIWGKKLDGGYLDYPTDTTFALYLPKHPESVENRGYVVGGIRTDRPYTVRHLPWHLVVEKSSDPNALVIPMNNEIYHYFRTADFNESLTGGRFTRMLAEYEARQVLDTPNSIH